jgi:D-sedoheptulose 7-phosphate isomerase
MGFGSPEGDDEIRSALEFAQARNALTFALPGARGSYAVEAFTDPVHSPGDDRDSLPHAVGERARLFWNIANWGMTSETPDFSIHSLVSKRQETGDLVPKSRPRFNEGAGRFALRAQVAREQSEADRSAALAIHERVERGGKLILFGNGGSATDANDWAIDCVLPPSGYRPIPAVSLALEPANITAVANDVGTEVIFCAS